jgi:hypothetical protein
MIIKRLGFGAWGLEITKKPIIEIGFFVVAPPRIELGTHGFSVRFLLELQAK